MQAEKIRAMALVHDAELLDIIVDGGESAKSLQRPGMTRLLGMVDKGQVQSVIVAKLDRLTRSVKDLCAMLERFDRRGVALISVAESLETGSRWQAGAQHRNGPAPIGRKPSARDLSRARTQKGARANGSGTCPVDTNPT